MMAALLSVKNLTAGYGDTVVLHGLSFELEEGGITAILGANGAGKTTTLRALCGLCRRRGGEISYAGRRIDNLVTEDVVRLGVAHVPDGRGTFASMTAEENLRLGAYLRHDRAAVQQDFDNVYTLFPRLKERRTQQAGTLSGGEQQMLAIARALMLRPRLLLLDEPSFGLAPLVVQEIYRTLKTINQQTKVSMLLVEQNATLALDLADHAYLVETGRVVISGDSETVKADETIRRSYLGY
jgi:branched-chain amino acid transport system ATP-binding protein